MPAKFQSIKYVTGVSFAWLTSVGVLTSIFIDIEAQHRKEDKELIRKLQEEIKLLKDVRDVHL